MKRILLFCALIFIISDAFATHIAGGEIIYQYLGPGATLGTSKYRITLKLFRDELGGGAAMPASVFIGIFDNGTNGQYPGPGQPFNVPIVNGPNGTPVPVDPPPPCMTNPPPISYNVGYYELVVDLPDNLNGYTASYQTCCRANPLINVLNPTTGQGEGSTYLCTIPGTNQLPVGHNSSPQFATQLARVCHGYSFTLNFSATDPDGDSLVYSFCNAFDRGASVNAGNVNPNPPPYNSVTYINGYSAIQPLGDPVTINPQTGIISGIAPPLAGKYVVCVCISEYRNGLLIGVHRKDFILNVSDCIITTANPNPDFITCDGFTVNFFHNSVGASTVFWDFGDPSTLADTSWLNNPTYTYPDTGTYIITFIINRGQPCTDTAYRTIKVYPGFLPGFLTSPALCANTPVQFTDTTYSRYGAVNSWRWDFGDPATLADTSHLQNPVYTYTAPGTYTVTLRVTNDKGCDKTYTKDITINGNPLLSVFPADSVYCGLDTLQLNGVGTGAFIWTPPINIIGATTATPQVFPTTTTWYHAKLTDANGCITNDSLKVIPKFDLSNAIAGPITICEEDTVTLTGTSNYSNNITWQWTPAATVESPANDITRVYPIVNTTYTLRTRWGNNCVATKTHTISVTPLAIANAGPDAFVCGGGQTSTQLNASGGISYSWTPTTGLSNPNIRNPIASPTVPTYYVVAVGVAGCPKLRTDTVFVNVGSLPVFNTINDTLICTIDTLKLTTNGTGSYVWSPNYMMSSTTVASPLVSPDVPTWYYVQLTDAVGCQSVDSVFVDVKSAVSLNAGADTTICQTDGFTLKTVSDGLYYQWTPSTWLDFDNIKNPFTRPLSTITYTVVSSIGKCSSQDDITIRVVPYPAANAGPDISVCSGFSVQLNATGGSNYAWSPATFLNNPLIANPVSVNPTANIRYIVTVRDNLGCPKPVKDTVWVNVFRPVIADAGPRDTTVVLGEPLFLNATGADNYVWSPSTWLNNPNISNPVALPLDDIEYMVTATTNDGCVGTDRILVHLFKVDPDMYVPTAFTPNGDGNNDVLRPILLGMKGLNYFRVYNRWGVMMFSTTENGKGWDGRYNGKAQDPATFVWEAEGITYNGQVKKKKGYAVLIR